MDGDSKELIEEQIQRFTSYYLMTMNLIGSGFTFLSISPSIGSEQEKVWTMPLNGASTRYWPGIETLVGTWIRELVNRLLAQDLIDCDSKKKIILWLLSEFFLLVTNQILMNQTLRWYLVQIKDWWFQIHCPSIGYETLPKRNTIGYPFTSDSESWILHFTTL